MYIECLKTRTAGILDPGCLCMQIKKKTLLLQGRTNQKRSAFADVIFFLCENEIIKIRLSMNHLFTTFPGYYMPTGSSKTTRIW